MVKQIQIFSADCMEELQKSINKFCVDFFPEEIISIKINAIELQGSIKWVGCIVFNKTGY